MNSIPFLLDDLLRGHVLNMAELVHLSGSTLDLDRVYETNNANIRVSKVF